MLKEAKMGPNWKKQYFQKKFGVQITEKEKENKKIINLNAKNTKKG